MTRFVLRFIAVLAFCAVTTPASAQWRIGGALGAEHESSWDEFLVFTLEARRAVLQRNGEFAPRFSYFLRDGVTQFQIDVNVLSRLILQRSFPVEPYMGIGGALHRVSFEGAGSESYVGFNYVMGGVLRSETSMNWYGQFQYSVLHDAPNVALVNIGALWRLGTGVSASRK